MLYRYDEESTDELVADAKEAGSNITFYETTVPVIITVMATLIILAAVVLRVSKIRKDGE
jgi:hypothetical protein